jgi:hypothetical protein
MAALHREWLSWQHCHVCKCDGLKTILYRLQRLLSVERYERMVTFRLFPNKSRSWSILTSYANVWRTGKQRQILVKTFKFFRMHIKQKSQNVAYVLSESTVTNVRS